MGKHTPAPWIVGISHDHQYDWPVFRIKDLKDPKDDSELNANANLISAAPEMLGALKIAAELIPLARFWNCDDDYDPSLELAAIRSAIAKAEGRDA